MRKTIVGCVAALLAAVPGAAGAAGPEDGKYGTEDCYVHEEMVPQEVIVSPTYPFVHVPPGGGGMEIHCPIPPPATEGTDARS